MARGLKNAVVVIADVGSHITAKDAELSQCVVGKLLQQPFLNQKKFEAALVLVGTEGTDNDLNRQLSDYEHVTVAQELDIADATELMDKVESTIVSSPSAAQGDYIDALIVALQLLEERCAKGKWTRTIAVVSNGNGALAAAEDHIEQIRSQIEDSDCTITLALVDSTAAADKPSVKTELESVLRKFGAEVQHISTAADAESVAKPPPVAPTTVFRGGLEISDRFSIGVWAYNGVSAVTAPSLKKMSIPATEDDPDRSGKVKMERAHFSVENPDTAIAPEEQIKAYKYGAEFVPFNQSDMIAFQWESTKSLQTLGFMPRSNLRRDHFADK